MAAHIDLLHASAKHQSLHHFVAKAEWSDKAIMQRVREWVTAALDVHAVEEAGYYGIIDDMGFPKKGRHSVGVASQYCGELGKQDNCQVAVSLSIATQRGSLPVAWQLYVPKEWIDDRERGRQIRFAITRKGLNERKRRTAAKREWLLAKLERFDPQDVATLAAAIPLIRLLGDSTLY